MGAEAYSFGQPSTGDAPDNGEPNTFIFGFGRVGGSPLFCGNGVLDIGEECDDGNGRDGDDCLDGASGLCIPASCGDGYLNFGTECCDPGLQPGICPSDCSCNTNQGGSAGFGGGGFGGAGGF